MTPYFRVGTGTQPFGDIATKLNNLTCIQVRQGLSVGVGANKLHAFDITVEHVANGIAATTANAYYFNDSVLLDIIDEFKHFPYSFVLFISLFQTDFSRL
ncbi:conserved hypothetical protein [Marinobacter salarius]|nr:conserved hypothetical protein [Marinobacter salarius]